MIFPRTFTYIYITICFFSLGAMTSSPMAYMVLKPLIVGSLLTFYIVSLRKQHSLIILALVFAIIGDVLLLFESDLIFKLGIGAFLIMQILYILYLKQFKDNSYSLLQKSLIIAIIVTGLFFIGLSFQKMGDDLIYICIYTIALTYMGITAIKFPRLKRNVSIIGIGAILFIFSDLTLAINKYIYPLNILRYLVMVLYMIGQYLIIVGITQDAKEYFNRVHKFELAKNKSK